MINIGCEMKDHNQFIDDAKLKFKEYRVVDSDCSLNAVSKLNIDDIQGSFIAIAGDYLLNCEFNSIIYKQEFYLVIVLDRTGTFRIPIVQLPKERKGQFEHIYPDLTCCLGHTHEIIQLWNKEQNAIDFIEKFIDPFLINFISFKNTKKCATEEWKHGYDGTKDYYSGLLQMNPSECHYTLPYIYDRIKINKMAKGHHPCPCGSDKHLRICHAQNVNSFMNELQENKELLLAFMQDMRGIMERN
jgi:hypothetical protein